MKPTGPTQHAGSRSRLAATLSKLRAEGRGGLSVYLPVGYPAPAASLALFEAAIRGGADWLEVGIPFSDPVADGPILQAASAASLRHGTRVADAFALAASLREKHPQVPLVAMTYGNIVHRVGWDAFAAKLQASGIDGLIVPDVPLEEARPLREALAAHGLAHIPLVTPATDAARMKAIAATCTGFLYVVANVGVTGQSDPGPLVGTTVKRARAAAPGLHLAVGFGVRWPADVKRILDAGADAVIVGSHIVSLVRDGAGPREVAREVAKLRDACAVASDASSR